jgi:uncharacterized low-complexity protein
MKKTTILSVAAAAAIALSVFTAFSAESKSTEHKKPEDKTAEEKTSEEKAAETKK